MCQPRVWRWPDFVWPCSWAATPGRFLSNLTSNHESLEAMSTFPDDVTKEFQGSPEASSRESGFVVELTNWGLICSESVFSIGFASSSSSTSRTRQRDHALRKRVEWDARELNSTEIIWREKIKYCYVSIEQETVFSKCNLVGNVKYEMFKLM